MADLLFGFRGRVNRAKYWLIVLGILVAGLLPVCAALAGKAALLVDPQELFAAVSPFGDVVFYVFLAAAMWIWLAVTVKRFHDRDKTGWWVLIVLVPMVGALWYLIEAGFVRGTDGQNKYGSDPLARY